jgi:hypothetical protein
MFPLLIFQPWKLDMRMQQGKTEELFRLQISTENFSNA